MRFHQVIPKCKRVCWHCANKKSWNLFWKWTFSARAWQGHLFRWLPSPRMLRPILTTMRSSDSCTRFQASSRRPFDRSIQMPRNSASKGSRPKDEYNGSCRRLRKKRSSNSSSITKTISCKQVPTLLDLVIDWCSTWKIMGRRKPSSWRAEFTRESHRLHTWWTGCWLTSSRKRQNHSESILWSGSYQCSTQME